MTILVTGATGQVGRHVVDHLVRRGAQVRALVRDPAAADLPVSVDVVRGDLLDVDALRSAARSRASPRSFCSMRSWPTSSPRR